MNDQMRYEPRERRPKRLIRVAIIIIGRTYKEH